MRKKMGFFKKYNNPVIDSFIIKINRYDLINKKDEY
jgi:hypothetical protein